MRPCIRQAYQRQKVTLQEDEVAGGLDCGILGMLVHWVFGVCRKTKLQVHGVDRLYIGASGLLKFTSCRQGRGRRRLSSPEP